MIFLLLLLLLLLSPRIAYARKCKLVIHWEARPRKTFAVVLELGY